MVVHMFMYLPVSSGGGEGEAIPDISNQVEPLANVLRESHKVNPSTSIFITHPLSLVGPSG